MADNDSETETVVVPETKKEAKGLSQQDMDDAVRKVREELKNEHAEGKRASEEKIAALESKLEELVKWQSEKDEADKKREESGGDKNTIVMPPSEAIQQNQANPDHQQAANTDEVSTKPGKKKSWRHAW